MSCVTPASFGGKTKIRVLKIHQRQVKNRRQRRFSYWTKTDGSKTVDYDLLRGAGKQKGPLKTESRMSMCFIYSNSGYQRIQQVSKQSLGKDVSFQYWILPLTAETTGAVSTSWRCTCLLGREREKKKQDYEGKRTFETQNQAQRLFLILTCANCAGL